jgi:hypothetical protein
MAFLDSKRRFNIPCFMKMNFVIQVRSFYLKKLYKVNGKLIPISLEGLGIGSEIEICFEPWKRYGLPTGMGFDIYSS